MHARVVGLAAALLLAGLAGPAAAQVTGAAPAPAAKAAANPGDDPVVAVVDGTDIRRSDVTAAIASLPKQYRDLPLETLFPSVLNQLIDRQLLLEAARTSGLEKDPAVEKRVAEMKERVLQEAYLGKTIDADVTDAKVKAAYEQTIKQMPAEIEVRARHILVKTEDEAKALKKELDAGADFAKLAGEKSSDGSAKSGGDLGFFTKDQMVPEFSEVAFKLKPGEVSGPVKTAFGWHLIKVEEVRPMTPPTLEQMSEQIRGELAQAAIGREVDRLREGAKIETFNSDGTPAKPAAPADAAAPAKPAAP